MIGITAKSSELQTAEEFFELFKTPWEPAVPTRKYRVILSTDGSIEGLDADLFLVYGSTEQAVDRDAGVPVEHIDGPVDAEWAESVLPIYSRIATFTPDKGTGTLQSRGRALDYWHRGGGRVVRRIGYDLFCEVRHLLTEGQPVPQASTPTLELHIAFLRQLLLESGVAFMEVPPRPDGYDFICCLTHDVDFFGIRRHRFDRTLAGFVARASLGTLADLVRGRRTLSEAAQNWLALSSLPLVFLGLAPDFWRPFEDYARADKGRRSTFFLVPFKGRPGLAPDGTVDSARAVPYQISEIQDEVRKGAGKNEFAVHGIDAWRDARTGQAEMEQLTALTGGTTPGVRMHWLYFDSGSPARLEAAGFNYDSTCGYNGAVGYRAGTSQVFRLPGSQNLMELPLSIMDSALFYSGRMGLARQEALPLCHRIVANARRHGGTVVINWHERSLAPERLWERSYQDLLEEVEKGDRAWFATAQEAVDWFRWRRSIRFTAASSSGVTVTASAAPGTLPPAVLRIQRPTSGRDTRVDELSFGGRGAMTLELEDCSHAFVAAANATGELGT